MFRFDWLGLAEGAVADHRGMLTLVGFGTQVLALPVLPANVALTVIGLVEADEGTPPLAPDTNVSLAPQVTGPAGQILLAGQQSITAQPPLWRDIPMRMQVMLGVGLNLTEYGRHVVSLSVTLPGQEALVKERAFWVREPTEVLHA